MTPFSRGSLEWSLYEYSLEYRRVVYCILVNAEVRFADQCNHLWVNDLQLVIES